MLPLYFFHVLIILGVLLFASQACNLVLTDLLSSIQLLLFYILALPVSHLQVVNFVLLRQQGLIEHRRKLLLLGPLKRLLLAASLLLNLDLLLLLLCVALHVQFLKHLELLLLYFLSSCDLFGQSPRLVNLLLHADVLFVEQLDAALDRHSLLLCFLLGSLQVTVLRLARTSPVKVYLADPLIRYIKANSFLFISFRCQVSLADRPQTAAIVLKYGLRDRYVLSVCARSSTRQICLFALDRDASPSWRETF